MKNSKMKTFLKKIVLKNKFLYVASMTLLGKRSVFNPLVKHIRGRGNIIISPATVLFSNCKVDIAGNNNLIHISDFCVFNNVTFLIRGDNHRIKISKSVKFNYGGSLHMEDEGGLLEIGEDAIFEEVHIAVTEPGSRIVIGAGCMFAYDIDLRTGDSHSVIDAKTNQRINPAQDVVIDEHVWVGSHCSILKGVHIHRDCIVATRTVLTKTFHREGVIIGGSPARILKEDITWQRQRTFTSDKATIPVKAT